MFDWFLQILLQDFLIDNLSDELEILLGLEVLLLDDGLFLLILLEKGIVPLLGQVVLGLLVHGRWLGRR